MPSDISVRCLLAAGRHGSFTKAADELFMTRQAVSRQIALMEKELGVLLFTRTTAKVELTPVGELYTRFFRETMDRWEETRRKAETVLSEQGNLIHIGCLYDTDLGEKVLELIQDCRAEGHALRVDWERREPYDLLDPLLSGRLDLIFSFDRALEECRQAERLESALFVEAQAVLAVRDDYPGVRPGASAQDFLEEPCFLSEDMVSADNRQTAFLEEWAGFGIQFSDLRIVSNRETLQTMVELGRGVTICTSADRFPKFPHILSYPLGRRQQILCIWRRGEARPQVLTFLGALRTRAR